MMTPNFEILNQKYLRGEGMLYTTPEPAETMSMVNFEKY